MVTGKKKMILKFGNLLVVIATLDKVNHGRDRTYGIWNASPISAELCGITDM